MPDSDTVRISVLRAVAKRINDDKPFLEILAESVMPSDVTTGWINSSWQSLVDILESVGAGHVTTQTAWAFTQERIKRWPGQQREWIFNDTIWEIGHGIHDADRATHYLTCLINLVDEVSRSFLFFFLFYGNVANSPPRMREAYRLQASL